MWPQWVAATGLVVCRCAKIVTGNGWITKDTTRTEIEVRGQRILGMVWEDCYSEVTSLRSSETDPKSLNSQNTPLRVLVKLMLCFSPNRDVEWTIQRYCYSRREKRQERKPVMHQIPPETLKARGICSWYLAPVGHVWWFMQLAFPSKQSRLNMWAWTNNRSIGSSRHCGDDRSHCIGWLQRASCILFSLIYTHAVIHSWSEKTTSCRRKFVEN